MQCSGSGRRNRGVGKHDSQSHPGWTSASAALSKKSESATVEVSNKTERSQIDSEAPMGYATTRVVERVLASVGKLGAPAATEFEPACDVAGGGVLAAVPALLAQGLLRRPPSYQLPQGFYGIDSIFLVLALMALARIRSWNNCVTKRPANGARFWGWTVFQTSARCAKKSNGYAKIRAAPRNGMRSWPKNGWRVRTVRMCITTAMGTCAFITERKRRCRVITWRGNGCVCERRWTTGSMPWMVSRFSTSTRRSIRD